MLVHSFCGEMPDFSLLLRPSRELDAQQTADTHCADRYKYTLRQIELTLFSHSFVS